MLSVVAMFVCNPDRSPVGINRGHAAPTPTGRAEIISDRVRTMERRSQTLKRNCYAMLLMTNYDLFVITAVIRALVLIHATCLS
jgi:hypothetical protein